MEAVPSNASATPAPTQELPTIVLVQGSFQISKVYCKLKRGLAAHGYPTIHPELPSCSNTDREDFPQVSLIDDALAVRTVLTRQVEYEEKLVMLVMHSYGGLVGSEAATEELSYAKRRAQGLPGGVIHLFLYAAFLLNEGQSVLSAFGESANNDVKVSAPSILCIRPSIPKLSSSMAASTCCTAKKSSTATSQFLRHRCGLRG